MGSGYGYMKDEQAPSCACQELAGLREGPKGMIGKASDTLLNWLSDNCECIGKARGINHSINNVTLQILCFGMRTWHYYVQLGPQELELPFLIPEICVGDE